MFPPPPRDVRRRRFSPQTFVLRFILTPAIAVVLGAFLAMLAVSLFGPRYPGKVTSLRTEPRSNGGTNEYVQYMFHVDGKRCQGEQRAYSQALMAMTPGKVVTVRSVTFAGYRYSTLVDGWGGLIAEYGAAIYLATLLPVIALVPIARGWLRPVLVKRLLRDGAVVTGEIESLPPGPPFSCRYNFTDAAGAIHRGNAHLSAAQSMALHAGDPVTIVYDPARPNRYIAYDFCEFQVMGKM
jgi:hypothetical protein